jgi:hypothetical protein
VDLEKLKSDTKTEDEDMSDSNEDSKEERKSIESPGKKQAS